MFLIKFQEYFEKSVRVPAVFLTSGCGRKGPMNSGLSVLPSFCPSVILSGSFPGIGSLVFPETQHDFRVPYGVVGDRSEFLEKKNFAPKMGKMGQN